MTLNASHALAGAAFLAPPLAVVAPLGLAPLLAATALAVLLARIRDGRHQPLRAKPVAVLFGLVVVLSLVSALWSIVPSLTLARTPQLLAALACGWLLLDAALGLGHTARQRVGRLLVAGFVVALALLAIERLADFPIRRLHGDAQTDLISLTVPYKRALTVLAIMVWPAALVLWRRRPVHAALLLAATFGVLLMYDGGSARSALLFGLAVAGVAALAPQAAARGLAGLLIVYIAAAPLLHGRLLEPKTMGITMPAPGQPGHPFLARSGYHRLLIWHFTAERIAERPALGWGFDSARAIPGGKQNLDWAEQAMPLHPHNAVLQIWLELGLGGGVLLGILVGWALSRLGGSAWPRPDKAAALAVTASLAGVACLSYGVWQSWWMAAMLLAVALTAALVGGPATPRAAAATG